MKPQDNPEEKEGDAENAEAAPAAEAAPKKPAKKPPPAWLTGVMLVGFLVVALAVGYVIWLVVNTYHLVSSDMAAYGNGRVVDKHIYQDAFGWGSELMVDKKPDQPARIRFLLRDQARKPVTDASVEIVVVQIDDPATTFSAPLAMKEPGVYRGDVPMPSGGVWEARIRVKEGGNSYQITRRIEVPESEKEKADEAKKNEADKPAK